MVSQAARRNLEAHIAGEKAKDPDAILAPLADEPVWVIPGYILRGKQAIRALYENAVPYLSDELLNEYLRALDDPAVTKWGDDHCVIEYTDDYPHHRNMIVVVHFEDDKVKSENTYFRTIEQPAESGKALEGKPGVQRIASGLSQEIK